MTKPSSSCINNNFSETEDECEESINLLNKWSVCKSKKKGAHVCGGSRGRKCVQQQMPDGNIIVWKWEMVEHKDADSMEDNENIVPLEQFPFCETGLITLKLGENPTVLDFV